MSDSAKRIGSYDIVRELARGGMATVFLAYQSSLRRNVALKRVDLDSRDPTLAQRFVVEAELAARLSHPNIVTVYDFFEFEGVPFIAMEFVEGGSLRDQPDPLSLPQVVGVMESVLAGLEHAEKHGIAHRDLKPDNLLVGTRGTVKVADFGLARAYNAITGRLTRSGVAMGTPAYMAPEQALGDPLSPATDLYAVGVIAYELLAGQPPFDPTDTPMAVLYRHVNNPVPSLAGLAPEVDPAICRWVEWLLSKSPAARPRSAHEAWRALEAQAVELLGPFWRHNAQLPTADPTSGRSDYESFAWPAARGPSESDASEPVGRGASEPVGGSPPEPADAAPGPVSPTPQGPAAEDIHAAPTVQPATAPATRSPTEKLPASGPVGPSSRDRRPLLVALAALGVAAAIAAAIILIGGEEEPSGPAALASYRVGLKRALRPMLQADKQIELGLGKLEDDPPASNNLTKVTTARGEYQDARNKIRKLSVPKGQTGADLKRTAAEALAAQEVYLNELSVVLSKPTSKRAGRVSGAQKRLGAALRALGRRVVPDGDDRADELGKLVAWTRDVEEDGDSSASAPALGGGSGSPAPSSNANRDEKAACQNNRDDDGDNATDYPHDDGCLSASDDNEAGVVEVPECENKLDDDGDGKKDAADPGCAQGIEDSDRRPDTELCGNDKDDDGDNEIDEGDCVSDVAAVRAPSREIVALISPPRCGLHRRGGCLGGGLLVRDA